MAQNQRGDEVNYLGIDPGKQGALALLDSEGGAVALHDMPGNLIETISLIRSFPSVGRAAIEEPFPGGKMSAASCMTFGRSVGELRAILATLGIPFCMVKPQDWQRVYGVTGKSRGNDSIGQCLKLYPDAPLLMGSKRKDGRSDALLIARWTWQQQTVREK
jgi:hypothetical protein